MNRYNFSFNPKASNFKEGDSVYVKDIDGMGTIDKISTFGAWISYQGPPRMFLKHAIPSSIINLYPYENIHNYVQTDHEMGSFPIKSHE